MECLCFVFAVGRYRATGETRAAMTSARGVDVALVAREDARRAFLSSIARARDALSSADDDARRDDAVADEDGLERDDADSRDADVDVDARALARAADDADALAAVARLLESSAAHARSVSEFEDEDASTSKLERAATNAANAATLFRDAFASAFESTTEDARAIDGFDGFDRTSAVERVARLGREACDETRDATWDASRERLRASGWPPSLRPTALKTFSWSLDDRSDETLARAFRALRATSAARSAFAGETSFAHDDVALAFVEDLAESLRVTFATMGSLSDPRRPERLCACAVELAETTPGVLRAELDRVVFADDPKASVTTARNYLSMLVHATSDVVRSHVCVACAESEDPWWLHVADQCRAFDERVSRLAYHDPESTPRLIDALVCDRAHAEAWLDAEREHATSRAAKIWRESKHWTSARGDGDDVKAPYVAQTVVTETKNALESACGLSRADWRSYFVKRVIAPALDDFLDECEARAVGLRGLGALVASTGSWRSGSDGAATIASAVNACAFVARAFRAMAEETEVLTFGGEAFFEEYAKRMEKFIERWIDAVADAAASQFADKVIGDVYAGSTHAGRYETIDDDDETIERNHAPSGYMLAALGPLRDRTRDARDAFGAAAFEKCWRSMASKTSRVVLERVACVATFTRAGAKQFDRDRVAHADAFAECAASPRGAAALRAKTKALIDCVSALSCETSTARDLIDALQSDGMKALSRLNALKTTLGITALDDASLRRVLSRRADVGAAGANASQ